ncbi:MAG TPA: helix-turn-helix domain-containing protein [Clostridiales bacterium]|nr:helix-turn-helix domain-containing protein [Clostridiales bacterium]
MSRYSHFTTKERESLLVLIKSGKSNAEIARELKRSPSTISREIKRNSRTREEYSAIEADQKYIQRRK